MFTLRIDVLYSVKQGNHRLYFARAVHSRDPLPADTRCGLSSTFVNVPEEDRATDIGNMHKNLVKIARVVPENILADRQTHRHIRIAIFRNRSRVRGNNNVNASHRRVQIVFCSRMRLYSLKHASPCINDRYNTTACQCSSAFD